MILEAFSCELKRSYPVGPMGSEHSRWAEDILHGWLQRILKKPPVPGDHVAQIIHTEIARLTLRQQPHPASPPHVDFVGRSTSGTQLLKSLYAYCKSYDQWQFSRWVHQTQASDFS